jgi:hypothetical protein
VGLSPEGLRNSPRQRAVGSRIGIRHAKEPPLPDKPEIEPRKERRAFAVWVVAALVLLAAGIFVVANVLRTIPTQVVDTSPSR